MKKILLFILMVPVLSNCGQYSAMIGPSYTLVETGSVLQATGSLSRSLAMKRLKVLSAIALFLSNLSIPASNALVSHVC